GAQSLVKDFFSGFFILLENQFTVGDVITIDGKTGTVEEINLRTTRMRSLDGTYHTVPNGAINSVSNMTHKWSRMLVVIGAGYREDPDHVRAVINRVGKEMFEDEAWKDRLLEPPVVLGLDNLNASSIDFKVVGRTRSGEQWAAEREFRRRVKIQFDLEDIEIPFQYVNYVQAEPERSRVLQTTTPSLRKKIVEESTAEVPDEGAGKREAERAKGTDENHHDDPEHKPA
ncbi:MAG: mechanosensitive ion channel family protein, partial [Planctomycetes bacterium]|nr:mechanosensitive ion channel family protein [Planctomycetota bacterium]